MSVTPVSESRSRTKAALTWRACLEFVVSQGSLSSRLAAASRPDSRPQDWSYYDNLLSVIIRQATVDDLTAIQDLYALSAFENYKNICKHEEIEAVRQKYFNTESLQNELANPSDYGTWFVADDGGLKGILLEGYNSDTQAEVYSFFVAVGSQNQGVGTKLFQHFENQARQKGCTEIVVDTTEGTNAEKFYKKMGFETVSKGKSGHFPTSPVIELHMVKPLDKV